MTEVRFTPRDGDTTCVNFPYDAEVVSIVKAAVPAAWRQYDPATKTWSIHLSQLPNLESALMLRGHAVTISGTTLNEAPSVDRFFEPKIVDDYDAVSKAAQILSDIPEKQRGRVFREMAKSMYPDLYRGTP